MPINVLLVDDSAVARGLMAKALTADPEIHVIGRAFNGEMAIAQAKETQPDIIILDIEMPVMDGMTALPELLKAAPRARIIIASSLTTQNADISLKALELGAADYLAKPSAKFGQEVDDFFLQLTHKVKVLAASRPAKKNPSVSVPSFTGPLNEAGTRALAIASSTGGPQALISLLGQLKGQLKNIPIFITQHMPATFTTILAEHLTAAGGRSCIEAKGGEVAQPGYAYVAPGDYHMVVEKNAKGEVIVRLNQDAPENYCRPSADPMLRSLSQVYGPQLAVAILTGMGQDGLEGSRVVVNGGGSVIAQDEASCVVYGMPKVVVENQLCKAVLALSDMGQYLSRQVDG